MLIDWFTVAAQVVNFIILALLLRRFLYKPVTKAIADRKQKIANQLLESEKIREEALQTKALYEEKFRQFEKERVGLLETVRKEVEEEKSRMFNEIEKETEELRAKLIRSFKEEQLSIHNQITARAHREVFALAQKTLNDLASQNLEEHIIDEFITHLEKLEPIERQLLKRALDDDNTVIVRTAFNPDNSRQRSLSKVLKELLKPEKITPEFELKPDLICGVEIQINHYKLEWHVSGYLQEAGSRDLG